jgi:hypothetical protein
VKTPDADASRAVNKTRTSDLSNSTVIGCSKCEELPKDRFTKVRDCGWCQYIAELICKAVMNNFDSKKLAYFLISCRHKLEAIRKAWKFMKLLLRYSICAPLVALQKPT